MYSPCSIYSAHSIAVRLYALLARSEDIYREIALFTCRIDRALSKAGYLFRLLVRQLAHWMYCSAFVRA